MGGSGSGFLCERRAGRLYFAWRAANWGDGPADGVEVVDIGAEERPDGISISMSFCTQRLSLSLSSQLSNLDRKTSASSDREGRRKEKKRI